MKTYTQLIEELCEAHPNSTLAGARTRLARANTARTLSTINRLKEPNKDVTGHIRPYYTDKAKENQERNATRIKDAKTALQGHGESEANIAHIGDASGNLRGAVIDGKTVQGFVGSKGTTIKLKGGGDNQLRTNRRNIKAQEPKPAPALYPHRG